MQVLARIGLLVIIGYACACAALFFYQRSLIYFPQPRSYGGPQARMMLAVPGAELEVSVRPRPGADAILYFGGNAEDVSANLASFSAAFPNHALYFLHYRQYGASSGKLSEEALRSDALALFDHIHALHSKVVVVGRSLGSGVAVRLASARPVSRLALVTAYDSLQEIAAGQHPYFPVRWLLLDKFESWRYAPGIRVPTQIISAAQDELIPSVSSERLYGRFAQGVAQYTVIAGTGHNSISDSPAYLTALGKAVNGGGEK